MPGLHDNLFINSLTGSEFKELFDVFLSTTSIKSLKQAEEFELVLPANHRFLNNKDATQQFKISSFTNQLKDCMIYMYGALTIVPDLKKLYVDDESIFKALYDQFREIKSKLDEDLGNYKDPLTTKQLKNWEKLRSKYEWNQGYAKIFYDLFQSIRVYFYSQSGYQNGLLVQISKLHLDIDDEKRKILGLINICKSLNCKLVPDLENENPYYKDLEVQLDVLESKVNEKLGVTSQFPTSSDVIKVYNKLKSAIDAIKVKPFDLNDSRWDSLTNHIRLVNSQMSKLERKLKSILKSSEYLKFIQAQALFNELYDLFENFKEMKSMAVMADTDEREGSGGLLYTLGLTRVKYKQKNKVFNPKELLDRDSALFKDLKTIEDFVDNTNIDVSNISTVSPKVAQYTSTLKTIEETVLENYASYEKIVDVLVELQNQYSKPLKIRETYGEKYNTVLDRVKSDDYKKLVEEINTDLKKLEYMQQSSSESSIESLKTQGRKLLESLSSVEPELISLNSKLNVYESEQSFRTKLDELQSDLASKKDLISTNILQLQGKGVIIQSGGDYKQLYRGLSLKYHPDKNKTVDPEIFIFITSWYDANEAIPKIETEISRTKKYLAILKKSADKPKITSPEELKAYEKEVDILSKELGTKSADIDQLQKTAKSWIASYKNIYDQQRSKYNLALSQFEGKKSAVQEKFKQYGSSILNLKTRIQDLQNVLNTQFEDSPSVRTKLENATDATIKLTQLQLEINQFDFKSPPPDWFLSEENADAETVEQRATDFEKRAEKLILDVSSSIQSGWAYVLENEYERSSETEPLLSRMWNSITGEKYARKMDEIFAKSNQLSGEAYASALSRVQRRNALIAAGSVGLTAVLFYLFLKGKLYWKKRKLWKRLEEAKPRLMWIIIQPYDKTSLEPVTVIPSEENTYPYEQVMDVIQSTLKPSNELSLKRLKRSKGKTEYGVQTYMTIELLPDIQSFLWDELMRQKITNSSIINAAQNLKKDSNKIYLPVFSE